PAELRNRFCISDAEVEELSRQALIIEKHYGRPMDVEWAKDGISGKLYIVQARPETVKSRAHATRLERYQLKARGEVLSAGRAAAIVTNRGGRTCHAAIIARELGVPAVVGTGDAMAAIQDGQEVTISCAEGDTGYIYAGKLDFEVSTTDLGNMPPAPLKIMMNVGNPERAFDFAQLPHQGIGLARLEFIIARQIGVHPRALLEYEQQTPELKAEIDRITAGYASPV